MTSVAAKSDPTKWDLKAHFDRAAATYERQVGILTRTISDHLISISQPPLSSSSVVLDNATGPGITSAQILGTIPESDWPKEIHATDLSPAMIEQVKAKGLARVQAQVMDCRDLTFPDNKFSHIYMAFVIFALDNPEKAARELYRTLQPGGCAYVTSWKTLGWAPPVDRALKLFRPDMPSYKGPVKEEWFKGETLKACLVSGGFDESKVQFHAFPSTAPPELWDGSKEFVESGILNPVVGDWSEDEQKRFYKTAEEEMMKEKANGVHVDFPCWVAVAQK